MYSLSRVTASLTTTFSRSVHIGFRKMANVADSYSGMLASSQHAHVT